MKASKKAGAVLALALLAGWGCSDFLSGPGLTENPNNPTQATAIQILVAVQSSAATRFEGQVARCASIFTQQLIGSNNQQLQYCTSYGVQEGDISGAMAGFYTGGGLLGLRSIQAYAATAGDSLMMGIAKVWEAYNMGTAASVWGDLPYSEAVTPGIESPILDSQQSIYAAVQTRLDEAISALTAAAATASGNCSTLEGDLIYCATSVLRATQVARWIRAAHTLKARFHLHLVERNGVAEYNAALTEALLGINEVPTSATNAIHEQGPGDFRFFHGSIQDFDANIWGEFLLSRQDVVAGNAMVQIMKSRNDTVRMRQYFDTNSVAHVAGTQPGDKFVGANQNNVTVRSPGCAPVPASCPSSVVNTTVRRVFTFRQPMITWAENQLILAEARFKTGDSAGAAVNVNAVRTAVGLPALAAPTFVDVMTEKYIAMYQNIEVWSDYKRTCIPTLVPNGSTPEVLGRLPYGAAERNANANIPLPSAYPTGTTGSSPVRNWDDPNACP
jgi:hypothetical protein